MCCSILIQFNSILKQDELPGPETALSDPEKEPAEDFCCPVSSDIFSLLLDLKVLFSATMSRCFGTILSPASAERGLMSFWGLMSAMSLLLSSVRPATGQVRFWIFGDFFHLIYHSLLQNLASSLMMLSSSDEDGKVNLMDNLFRETDFFMNRAILSELRTILFLMS